MPIKSRRNQYQGVNAHLHSLLQNQAGGWPVFHSAHVIHVGEALDKLLPSGYVVGPEVSLQIREFHPDTGERLSARRPKSARPDVSIYDVGATPKASPANGNATTPTLTLPVLQEIDDPEIYLTALSIREVSDPFVPGKPVTWLELLSPSNKPLGSGYVQYRQKRISTLKNGIALVEIDYLHQTHPVSDLIPSYPDRESGAYPYIVIVTNPRPTLEVGEMQVFGFNVDAAMPIINIPLSGEDTVTLDFGAVYNRSYESFGYYSLQVDYEREPMRFETYHEAEQQRIHARMKVIAEAHTQGLNLEEGPFPLGEHPQP